MEESPKLECLTSADAFVEGGTQNAYDDVCSICLETFFESDPSTLTGCKHEYHLQCILEWCQRSSHCPMCWQPISLKDPISQALLEGVIREKTIKQQPPRNTTIFHHPTLGDFELEHVPVDANETELEERIIQHLAAAAAMGRAHISRRQGLHGRSRGHAHPQYLVFSTNPNASSAGFISTSSGQTDGNSVPSSANLASPVHIMDVEHDSTSLVSHATSTQAILDPNSSGQSTAVGQDNVGPSEFQSLSISLKSRFNAVSARYKESFIKSTRGLKERLFPHSQSVSDIRSEVRRELNAGIATVSRMMEHLHTREDSNAATAVSQHQEGNVITTSRDAESRDIQNVGKLPLGTTTAASGSSN